MRHIKLALTLTLTLTACAVPDATNSDWQGHVNCVAVAVTLEERHYCYDIYTPPQVVVNDNGEDYRYPHNGLEWPFPCHPSEHLLRTRS